MRLIAHQLCIHNFSTLQHIASNNSDLRNFIMTISCFWIHKYKNAHDKVHAFEKVWIRKWQGQMTTKANETAPSDKRVLAVLHRMIMDGSLAPGSKISEVSVADMFDVSRTPARLALRALEVEGLIKKREGHTFDLCRAIPSYPCMV